MTINSLKNHLIIAIPFESQFNGSATHDDED